MTMARSRSKAFGQTIRLAMPISSSSVMKITPCAVPGRWRTSTSPATATRSPLFSVASASLRLTPRASRRRAHEGDRMGLERQRQATIVLDDMGAERHRRQPGVGLGVALGPAQREQRQVVLVADPVEAPHRPQRLAAIEAERTEGVGVGEPLQRRRLEAGAQPQVAHRIVTGAAPLDQLLYLGLLRAENLPQAQPHRMRGADVLGHRSVAGVEPFSRCAGEGGAEGDG